MINSAEKILFHVLPRDVSGTVLAKKLRKQGKVVGNVYGLATDSTGVYMDKNAIKKLYASHGDTSLIYLQVGESKKQTPVLISEYQTDPFGNDVLHVSFRRVDLSDPIEAEIPVHMIGEVNIPESVVTLVKDEVTVEALPADLPDKFEIDISGLSEIGQIISLADIVYDKSKVKLILDEDENPEDIPLVIVQEIAGEVPEEETPETEVGEGEELTEETKEGDEKTVPEEKSE
jgi:large subunit ribosomal protein L25